MPTKKRRSREQTVPYHTPGKRTRIKAKPAKISVAWQELDTAANPIVLARNGEPAAAVLRYSDYQRLARANARQRNKAWRELNALLQQVHARTRLYSPDEIENDIRVARAETAM